MEANDCEVIQLELKYCERCGGLWLRRQGVDKVYCAACSGKPPEDPLRRRVRTRPQLPVNREFHGQCEVIYMMSREEGQA